MHFLKLIILLMFPTVLFSTDDIYFIKNIRIVIDNKNISTARDTAKNAAFNQALELLLKKILSEKNLGKINTLQKGNLIKLVKEFKIKEENYRGSLYKALVDVHFEKEKIDNYLKEFNLEISSTISDSFLILALHKKLNNTYLWEKNNKWYEILKDEYQEDNLLNLFFPNLNYLNNFQIAPEDIISENQEKLSNILNTFEKRSGLIIYLDESFDTKSESISSSVLLKEFTSNFINEISISDSKLINNISKSSQIDLLAKFVIEELNNWWKKRTAISKSDNIELKSLYLVSSFSDLKESLEIEKMIRNSVFVDSLIPIKISTNDIYYELKSIGEIEKINLSLRPFGYKLIEGSQKNTIVISKLF